MLVAVMATVFSTDDGRVPTGALVVHMNVRVPSPVAVQVNSALLPLSTTTFCGGTVMTGGPTGKHRENRTDINNQFNDPSLHLLSHRYCSKCKPAI